MSVWFGLAVGLALLALGGELLVRGAVASARRLGVSPLLIGLTLVGFGTSTPELVTSLQAAHAGSPGIAIGNVVGSNISNILLVLGLTAMIAPVVADRRAVRRDGLVVLLVTGLCIAALRTGELTRAMGLAGLVLLLVYVVWVWLADRSRPELQGAAPATSAPMSIAIGLAVVGIGLTIYGADLLVGNAILLARDAGVSDTVVGLTIVAVGTSAPELVTSLVAALRRQSEVALGNVIGSNLYNLLGILGVTAAVRPITVPFSIMAVDAWVMGVATLALVILAYRNGRLGRAAGLSLAAGYGLYAAWLIATA